MPFRTALATLHSLQLERSLSYLQYLNQYREMPLVHTHPPAAILNTTKTVEMEIRQLVSFQLQSQKQGVGHR